MASKHLTPTLRDNFKRIIAQMSKASTDVKVLKIVQQANSFLNENDIGWDVVSVRIPEGYVFQSERRRAARAVTKANGAAPVTMVTPDKHALLKKAIVRHTSWPMLRDTLSMDIATATLEDLVSVAQLMGLDEKFVSMFAQVASKPVDPQMDIEDFIAGKNT